MGEAALCSCAPEKFIETGLDSGDSGDTHIILLTKNYYTFVCLILFFKK